MPCGRIQLEWRLTIETLIEGAELRVRPRTRGIQRQKMSPRILGAVEIAGFHAEGAEIVQHVFVFRVERERTRIAQCRSIRRSRDPLRRCLAVEVPETSDAIPVR